MTRLARVIGSVVLLLGWSTLPVFGDEPAYQPLGLVSTSSARHRDELVAERPVEPDSSLASQLAWFMDDREVGPTVERLISRLPELTALAQRLMAEPCTIDLLLQIPLESHWEAGFNAKIISGQTEVADWLTAHEPACLGIAATASDLDPELLRQRLWPGVAADSRVDSTALANVIAQRVAAHAVLNYCRHRPQVAVAALDDNDIHDVHCWIERQAPTHIVERRLTGLRHGLSALRTAVILANARQWITDHGQNHMAIVIDYLDGNRLARLVAEQQITGTVVRFY